MSKESQPIPFQLISISTEDFTSQKENYNDENPFDITFGFDISIDSTNKIVSLFTQFNFEQEKGLFLSLKSACHFQFEMNFWEQQIQENQITLPAPLITHLLVICVGTSRGIIHELKPNWAENVILPTLNVSEVLEEDPVFELDFEK